MTALHTSYGQLKDKLREAGIRYTTNIEVVYNNAKEYHVIRSLEVPSSKIVMDERLEEVKAALKDCHMDEIEISLGNGSIFIRIK